MKVCVRDFRKAMRKYLDYVDVGEEVELDRDGKRYRIVLARREERKINSPVEVKEAIEDVIERERLLAQNDKLYRMTHYGCGCEKADKAVLCSKHKRG